jgi:DNA-binding transcriptional MerR regulator/methylmalonyl-CoA mutase cobalamin-binding subunit
MSKFVKRSFRQTIDMGYAETYFWPMTTERSDIPRHPIRVVAKRTGLTPAVLRAWEKRYTVVVPSRTEGGQRLYSDADVERLSLLRRAVEEGRGISQVAILPTEGLKELVREDEVERRTIGLPESLDSTSTRTVLEKAQGAVTQMDSEELGRVLNRAALAFSIPTVLDEVVVPLLSWIGTAWESGRVRPSHEHLGTVVIRRFLEWMLDTAEVGKGAPVMVAATPAGEKHELGALLAAVSGAAEGWKAVFLGPDLPAEEVVAAALRLEAEVVTLSCVDPRTSEALPREVSRIRERLPVDVHLVVGGPLADAKEGELRREGVEILHTFEDLREKLRSFGARP